MGQVGLVDGVCLMEVAGFHNKGRWDPRIVDWIRCSFKLGWQTG